MECLWCTVFYCFAGFKHFFNKEVSEESLLGGNAKSMIYCHIMQYGEEVGLIAYVDCEKEREWKDKDFKGFRTITRLIGAYLDR